MREPTYRDALRHGWSIMIEHKVLWILGLFAALLGQMGILEIFTKVIVTAKYYTYYPFIAHFPAFAQGFINFLRDWNLPFDRGVWLVWLLVVMLAFGFLFLFVAVVSQGALIHCVAQFVHGKFRLASHEAWHAGVDHFGRLLLLQIIKKIVIGLLVLFVGFSTYHFIITPSTIYTTLFAISLLLALFLGSIISLLVTYAAGYVVVEELHLKDALPAAWRLLKTHSLVSVEVAVIMLLVNMVVAILAMVAIILFRVELAFLAVLSLATNSFALWSIGSTFGALFLTGIFVVLGSFITVYSTAGWMYLFMKMHSHGLRPRVHLFFQKLFARV